MEAEEYRASAAEAEAEASCATAGAKFHLILGS